MLLCCGNIDNSFMSCNLYLPCPHSVWKSSAQRPQSSPPSSSRSRATSQIYKVYHTFKDARETVLRTTRALRDLTRILEYTLNIVNANGGSNTTTGEGQPAESGHALVLEDLLTGVDNPVAACCMDITSILKLF